MDDSIKDEIRALLNDLESDRIERTIRKKVTIRGPNDCCCNR